MSEKEKIRLSVVRHEWPDEKEKKRKRRGSVLFLLACIFVSFIAGIEVSKRFNNQSSDVSNTDLARVEAVYKILQDQFYFGDESGAYKQHLIDSAIQGMISGTGDIHTDYMSAEEAQYFTQAIDRNFVGIGVSFFDGNGHFIVSRIFYDTPAYRAGVQVGDIIHRVDGTLVEGLSSDQIVSMVRGEMGTVVQIEFIRGTEIVSFDIARDNIKNTAFGEVNNGVGLLEIYQFGTTTGEEVKSYLEQFKAQGVKRIVIDMRDNGGGYLSSLEDVGSLFVPKGEILIQQQLREGNTQVSRSSGDVVMEFEKMVVLINENTASAAEVLTAALQENMGATVVGINSYGKGTVQQQYAFSDQSSLKYTIAEWLTPLGNHIDGVGIAPDIEAELHPVFSQSFVFLADESYEQDSVGTAVQNAQYALDFLGYEVDRFDGYFSQKTAQSLVAFQNDMGLEANAVLERNVLAQLRAESIRIYNQERFEKDYQLKKAVEVVNE